MILTHNKLECLFKNICGMVFNAHFFKISNTSFSFQFGLILQQTIKPLLPYPKPQ